ncbi:RNA-directed DNA polymerase [Caproiciproducens sp. AGMB10547]|uniref:RNA-directed DNA polymerase n=1 Tax=Caproiciproducens faecalis TaxID=2820301 RepID=A0ABS7DMC0_9FIRM|nr:RNA-directed DNA polymerase [Caproiciproducens faecalis]
MYQLKCKKVLKYLLKISDNSVFNQWYVASLIEPYIDISRGKPRLIEPPSLMLKSMQTRLKNMLGTIDVPINVFSGIKGRSYAQNAQWHKGNKFVYKIDLTAFFPSISRERVYSFFKEKLRTSPDIAEFLTNITTVNLDLSNIKSMEEINIFLESKNITTRNHLISGAPTSQILSYLANQDMFNEIQKLSDHNNITMTIYVDDLTFSSTDHISNNFKQEIFSVIRKYGYHISNKKVKGYSKFYPKLITGVIISKDGNIAVKNSLRLKTINELNTLKQAPQNTTSRKRLRGLVTATRQVEPNAYPSIHQFAFDKKYKV